MKWSVHDTCIPSSSVCLFPLIFPVICFELPVTQTFFFFPKRFELSGVDCISYIYNFLVRQGLAGAMPGKPQDS